MKFGVTGGYGLICGLIVVDWSSLKFGNRVNIVVVMPDLH